MSVRRPHVALAVLLLSAVLVAPASAAAPTQRGVVVDVLYNEPVQSALDDVDAAAALGANVIRLAVSWEALQPVSSSGYAGWYIDALDAVVARAKARSLKVIITPVFTPCWASSAAGAPSGCGRTTIPDYQISPPANPSTYATMAAGLARRWAGALAGIEVWNEPNQAAFWKSTAPARDYAKLVRATYSAVKGVDRSLPVVIGVTAGVDVTFLSQVRAQNVGSSYDAISVHPYNDGRSPETLIDPRYAASTFLQGLRDLRTALTNWRETRPVWITEMGWNTSTQRGALWLDGVSPDDQAAYLSRALAMLADPASGIAFPTTAVVYRLRDTGTDPADPQQNYGLMTKTRAAKPALAAVSSAFAALASAVG